ncbi:aminopeptidase P family protein [Sphingomonas nostoxanthinifaciens]|uniref:aminopeptidase P family protein n=1 Tax=Sphingomonas nostoxanthinifaciens TaxID=2872652 RepID=UPI001CC1DD21|nr:aminopeptidase P family protein [Sphingomonas nostoxanthinifaciens]UAK26772.1 aminopeptidase P family protein [Sphingomonas nostoxanthinifaciens]
MTAPTDRLAALRAELSRRSLDGFVVPLTDEHMSEYVGAYAQRLAWLTGFEGSAGTAAVLADAAAIFVDGRYTLQVRAQVSADDWSYQSVPQTNVASWLAEHVGDGARIGYDPWLHTKTWVETAARRLAERGVTLVAVATNPVDAVWADRPQPSAAVLEVQPDDLAGRNSAEKRQAIADWLAERKADAAVLSALDSIAWTFNVRGTDVARTPVALGFAVANADGTADLFVAPEKITDAVRQHLGNAVRVQPYAAFAGHLATLAGKRVVADPERAVAAIFGALEEAGATVLALRDPTVLPRAIKNAAELAGHRAAQARDGAAIARFLHWLSVEAPKGGVDELIAQDRLRAFRAEGGLLRDLSFDTISGAGPNGAIVHYRASAETNRPLEQDSLYLVDSGGQYRDGTTDITRTVAIGTPSAEMRDRFTRVLKGHIALARAVFPEGTRGTQLDTLARQHLWAAGVDYAHGTGHGVGSYLSVHEGPQRISPAGSAQSGGDEPLRAGMILSNEPGYYKTGAYGIRIENLVLVEERRIEGAEKACLGFETLTFAPIDRALIEPALLSREERDWLDAYHAAVRATIAPQLDGAVAEWLDVATAPL